MKHLRTSFAIAGIATALLASQAPAQPYCPELLNASALEKKYQRLAPIFSSKDTGWIFTSDQLDENYGLKQEAKALLTKIVAEFTAAGVPMAIMIAPPRPVVAGQQVVDATLGEDGAFSVDDAATSFAKMLDDVRATGAVVPNLLEVATRNPDAFYFQRDTHWTNTGAALSANALSAALELGTQVEMDMLATVEMKDERGSLSDIVDAVCGTRDAGEASPVFDYASLSGGDLLGDATATGKKVALLGTSFSDRYKRDQYQVADALTQALSADVENFSVSGGGLIGPIEAYVLSGALNRKDHDLVVWEFPYTESLNSTSALRQLLGALRMSRGSDSTVRPLTLNSKAQARIDLTLDEQRDLILFENLPNSVKAIAVDVRFSDDRKKTIKLRRKASVIARYKVKDWAVALGHLGAKPMSSITLRFEKSQAGNPIALRLGS